MPSTGPGKRDLSARQIARRLIESRQSQREVTESGRATAVGVACNDLYQGLSRWVGPDGCHALFTRALAQARGNAPTLEHVRLRPGANPYVDGVTDSIRAHDEASVAQALESMLVHLVELLERLIGADMATKLIERSIAESGRTDATFNDRWEEA
jgi:hypothetical protein